MEKPKSNRVKIVEQKVDGGQLSLKVEVPSDAVEQAYRAVYKKLVKHVNVPGFRPGRAPLPVLSNAVGRENFQKEVRKELLPEYYYEAIGATVHRAYSGVSYADENLSQGEPFRFTAKVSVAPAVKLGDHRSLKVKKKAPKAVGDDEIDAVLKKLQKKHSHTRTAEDETVREGDLVLLSVSASVEGHEFKLLAQGNLSLVIGEDGYLPGFDEKLIGQKTGQEFSFVLEMPKKDVENKALAGKKVLVKGKVKSVRRLERPKLDDEFAKDVGPYQTLDELKKKIRSQIEADHEHDCTENFDQELRKKLAELVDVTPPEALITERIDKRIDEMKAEIRGKPYGWDEYLQETGREEASLRKQLHEQVVEDLKVSFALDEIANEEALEVSDEEFNEWAKTLAKMLETDADELVERLDQSGQRVIERQGLRRDKAFKQLRERLA